jgi:hypothetical protein
VYLERFGVLSVDLVDEDDRGQSRGERFFEDEAGLGLGAFIGVDDEHDAIDHLHDTLHLATEVGVSGSVDDVDDVVAPADRGVLRLDRDAALALLVHRVHGTFLDDLVVAEGTGLLEHLVHERGLAMIDVSDDGNIADAIRSDGAI